MPATPEKHQLQNGPYRPPRLQVGDRASCLMRGAVVITSWTHARISWPRCKPKGRSHPSLLLDGELARAVRTEAHTAVMYWWGASWNVVRQWRRFLDVDRVNNPGTNRLVQASAEAGAKVIKAKEWTDAERQDRRDRAKRLDLGRHLVTGYHGPRWTPEQIALLGTLPDEVIARRIGRTPNAVRIMRQRLGIDNPADGRRR